MSVTILEALRNAKYNLGARSHALQYEIGREQLHNAIILLEKGYNPYTLIEPLLEKYGDLENVPERDE